MAVSTPTVLGKYASTANVTTSGGQAATAGAAVGSAVLVLIGGGAAAQTLGFTDSAGNTYSSLTAGGIASGSASTLQWFYCDNIPNAIVSGTTTFTATRGSSGGLEFIAVDVTGMDLSSLFSGSQTVGSSTTATPTATPSSALTVGAGDLVLMGVISNSTITFTAGSGYTIADQIASTGSGNPRSIGIVYKQITSGGSETPTATLSTSNPFGALAVDVLAASGAPAASGSGSFAIAGAASLGPATGSGLFAITGTASGTGASGSAAGTFAIVGAASSVARPTLIQIGDSLTGRVDSTSTFTPPGRLTATTIPLYVTYGLIPGTGSAAGEAVGGKPMVGTDAVGRTAAQSIATSLAAVGGYADIAVIALGTNDVGLSDPAWIAGMQAIMTNLGSSVGHVYWMNLASFNVANTNSLHFNPIMATTLAAYPNATLLDFNTWIHDTSSVGTYDPADWISPVNATHMTVQGWAKRDNFLARMIQGEAATGSFAIIGTGTLATQATAAGSFAVAGTATGKANATATGGFAVAGTAAGVASSGSGTGSFAVAGAASVGNNASGSGVFAVVGTSAGKGNAGGTGTFAVAGAAALSATANAQATIVITGAATPRANLGASGMFTLVGTGSRAAPGLPVDDPRLAITTLTPRLTLTTATPTLTLEDA